MKHIEYILLILFISVFSPLSISAQGYLEVYLKNGMHHRFYLDTFKELRTSKQSVDGMLSSDYITQQVVMNDSTYSYALADVDSIRFKKVTMDDMVDDMFTVLNEISPMLSDVNDITEAERFVDDIKACHNVRDAYVSGTSLIVEMMNINYIAFVYDNFVDISEETMEMTKRFASNLGAWSTSDKKALLVNQLWKNESRKSLHRLMEIEQDILKASGVQVDYMKGEADTTFYMTTDFSKYDYIHLVTHGCYNPKDNTHRIFSSSEFAAKPPGGTYTRDQIFEMFNPGSKFSYGVVPEIRKVYGAEEGRKFMVYYSCLTENDIYQKKSQSERTTILFNAACQSLKGNDQMAEAFFERGVDVYLGYDETNSVGHIAGKTLFCELMNGLSFDYVLQDRILPEWKTNEVWEEGNKVIANLKDIYNFSGNNVNKTFNDYFAFPVITNDNEESEASSLNDTQWKINVSGTTKTYKFEKELKCGFRYGKNREMTWYKVQECDEKDIKFKNHELSFNAILIPEDYLYGCDSLYYQAYTYDGLNYNLGDIKSIPGNLRQLRQQLIKFYESTGGENWIRNDNWCSEKPLGEWYGVIPSVTDNVTVYLQLDYNNLKGECELLNCQIIDGLSCRGNQLTSINLSGCSDIKKINCSDNQLTNLNVSDCKVLEILICDSNELADLNIFGCTGLKNLHCEYNQLTNLDVSMVTDLESIHCRNNQLTSLNASGCKNLYYIECLDNNVLSLNVSGCSALKTLRNGHLFSLDASGCTSLEVLEFYFGNQLTSLDVSGCTALQTLSCGKSQLTRLDVSGCTALQTLSCGGNQLTSLDVSGCTTLQSLSCENNQLTSLNVSGRTDLQTLNCRNNQLTSLNVSDCTALEFLYCDNNQLTGLGVSGCTALRTLECRNNHINQEIPEFFRNFKIFHHDSKYGYVYRNKEWIITTNEYGWWYPGEPESHRHGWKDE